MTKEAYYQNRLVSLKISNRWKLLKARTHFVCSMAGWFFASLFCGDKVQVE